MVTKLLLCLIPWLSTAQTVLVPFVGCPADVQGTSYPAPKGDSKKLSISPAAANKLAYYAAQAKGVLGPRGWRCREFGGSSGWELHVLPQSIDPENALTKYVGPAIVLTERDSATSGRYEVAEMIARMFPAYDRFLPGIRMDLKEIAEYSHKPSLGRLPSGPFPKDKLTNRTDASVEFETLPGNEGLGTLWGNAKSDYSTRGISILRDGSNGPNAIHLTVRLPSNLTGLAPAIISQLKREHPASTR